jgi:transposase
MERWEHGDIEDEHWKRMKEKGVQKMILRKRTVEHPFGTIKRWMNQGYLLLKGLRKVKGEFGFSVIAYNMKMAIRIKGVMVLIQAL